MRLEIILIFANNLLMKTLKLFTARLFYVKDNLHMKKKLVELSRFGINFLERNFETTLLKD